MWYFILKVSPKPDTENAKEAGGAYVNCWIDFREEEGAPSIWQSFILIVQGGFTKKHKRPPGFKRETTTMIQKVCETFWRPRRIVEVSSFTNGVLMVRKKNLLNSSRNRTRAWSGLAMSGLLC